VLDLVEHSSLEGKSLTETNIELLLNDFDSHGLVIGVEGLNFTQFLDRGVDYQKHVIRGLNRLRDEALIGDMIVGNDSYWVSLKQEVPIWRKLEQAGVVRVSNTGISGQPVDDYGIHRGENYTSTKVIAVKKPESSFLRNLFGSEKRYIPLR